MNLIQRIAAALFGREIKRLGAGWEAANLELLICRLRVEELEAHVEALAEERDILRWGSCALMESAMATDLELAVLRSQPSRDILAEIEKILIGIDKTAAESDFGYWETPAGARMGANKLQQIRELFKQ